MEERQDTMSKGLTVKRPMTNVARNLETLNLAWDYFGADPRSFVKAALNLSRFARAAGLKWSALRGQLVHPGARWLVGLVWIPALFKPVRRAG